MASDTINTPTPTATVSTTIGLDYIAAMQAALVKTAARFLYVNKSGTFHRPPENSLTFIALDALEERSIVTITELLRSKAVKGTIQGLRQLDELVLHRDAANHPFVEWNTPASKKFHDEHGEYLDPRFARLWDLNNSINEQLIREGTAPRYSPFFLMPESALMFSTILKASLKEDNPITEPRASMEFLTGFLKRLLQLVTMEIKELSKSPS